jgi:hypothetical protein
MNRSFDQTPLPLGQIRELYEAKNQLSGRSKERKLKSGFFFFIRSLAKGLLNPKQWGRLKE